MWIVAIDGWIALEDEAFRGQVVGFVHNKVVLVALVTNYFQSGSFGIIEKLLCDGGKVGDVNSIGTGIRFHIHTTSE